MAPQAAEPGASPGPGLAPALLGLDGITRRLRSECPWDREQDERSIVPHTVEEAYELADAAQRGDDARLLDELGDVLFQVYFLSLLLEERSAGSLAAVAEHCTAKLVRRHPHVFGDAEADSAAQVLRNWEAIKHSERQGRGGRFGELAANLPAPTYAAKLLRRAGDADPFAEPATALAAVAERARELKAAEPAPALAEPGSAPPERFERAGELLFAAVGAARALAVDPELALRAAADRFRRDVEADA